jgi:hypothetical protein
MFCIPFQIKVEDKTPEGSSEILNAIFLEERLRSPRTVGRALERTWGLLAMGFFSRKKDKKKEEEEKKKKEEEEAAAKAKEEGDKKDESKAEDTKANTAAPTPTAAGDANAAPSEAPAPAADATGASAAATDAAVAAPGADAKAASPEPAPPSTDATVPAPAPAAGPAASPSSVAPSNLSSTAAPAAVPAAAEGSTPVVPPLQPPRPKVVMGGPPGAMPPHMHFHHMHHQHMVSSQSFGQPGGSGGPPGQPQFHHHHHAHAMYGPPGAMPPMGSRVPPGRPGPKIVQLPPGTPRSETGEIMSGAPPGLPAFARPVQVMSSRPASPQLGPQGATSSGMVPMGTPPQGSPGHATPQFHHHHHHHAFAQPPPGLTPAQFFQFQQMQLQHQQAAASAAAAAATAAAATAPAPATAPIASAPPAPTTVASASSGSGASHPPPQPQSQPPTPAEEAEHQAPLPPAVASATATPPPADDDRHADSESSADFVESDDDKQTAPKVDSTVVSPRPPATTSSDAAMNKSASFASAPELTSPKRVESKKAENGTPSTADEGVGHVDAAVQKRHRRLDSASAVSNDSVGRRGKTAATTAQSRRSASNNNSIASQRNLAPFTRSSGSGSAQHAQKKPGTLRRADVPVSLAPSAFARFGSRTTKDDANEHDRTAEVDTVASASPERAAASDAHVRSWAKDRFARLLCPQQYYGQVVKVHNVRPLSRRPKPVASNHVMAAYVVRELSEAQHLLANGSFSGLMNDGSYRFSTQVQLEPKSSRRTREGPDRVTTFAVCELDTERVRFSETVGDAVALLDFCTACFVTDLSAFIVADLSSVKVHALVDVTWTLFSDDKPPTCPQHHVPLQLFEPRSRELLCALCTANDPTRNDCLVLSDLFSGNSIRSIQHSITDRLDAVQARLNSQVAAHRAGALAIDRRRQAVDLQFQLVQAALDAKKAELMDIFDEEDRSRDVVASRNVFNENEVRRHLTAALSHLQGIAETASERGADAVTAPFAQMATIVSSLGLLDSNFASEPIPTPSPHTANAMDTQLKISMEHVIRAVNDVSFVPRMLNGTGPANSPTRAHGTASVNKFSREPVDSPNRARARSLAPHDLSSTYPQRGATSPIRTNAQRLLSPRRQVKPIVMKGKVEDPTDTAQSTRAPAAPPLAPSPTRRAATNAAVAKPARRGPSLNLNTTVSAAASASTAGPSLGPNGSLLFDVELRRLIGSGNTVEWKVRIDDPGSWIGLGVGVGDDFNALANTASCDTRHLWIAPTNVPRMVKLRVTVGPHRHAKLTIHDSIGRQLDDNRIPHWNVGKLAYPQVSFGETPGAVTMVDPPHILPHPGKSG